MNKIFKTIILLLFSLYWVITIFFNLPDNYVKANFLQYEPIFSLLFYQRWSFFAPPPTSDDRLYYFFKHKTDSLKPIHTFEVIEDLGNIRRNKAPFNENETVIDYVLSNSLTSLNEMIRNEYELYKKANCVDGDLSCSKKFYDSSWTNFSKVNQVTTLFNYGKIIAKAQNIDLNNYEVKFALGQSFIPKFQDRNIKKSRSQTTTFETPYINLN